MDINEIERELLSNKKEIEDLWRSLWHSKERRKDKGIRGYY